MENLYKKFKALDFDIMYGMSKAIQNIGKNQYPYVRLNHDESISFFDESDNLNENLMKLEFDIFPEILKEKAKEKRFNIIENTFNQVLEKFDHEDTGLVEYKINLSPRNLDSILKDISNAYFYKGDNNILNLYENEIPDITKTIKLFPVYDIGDDKYAIRAAGCQMIEMPSVQLLKLMQDFLGKEKIGELNSNFHWIPKPLENFGFDRSIISDAMIVALEKEKSLTDNAFFTDEGIKGDARKSKSSHPLIKIMPMNEESKNFYLKYGNIGEKELDQCESLEVDTKFFLKVIKDAFIEKQKGFEKWFKESGSKNAKDDLEKIKKGINYLNQTIENLKNPKLPSQDISGSTIEDTSTRSIKK